MNIEIGSVLIDTDNKECLVTDKTSNSFRIFIKRRKNKKKPDLQGIDSNDWYEGSAVIKRFKLKEQ